MNSENGRWGLVVGTLLGIGAVSAFVVAGLRGLYNEPDVYSPFVVVEEIYLNGKYHENCDSISSAVNLLRTFGNHVELVPSEHVFSVTLPSRLLHPTIGDLAMDRSIRLEQLKKALCTGSSAE